jgi:hypothetical protein
VAYAEVYVFCLIPVALHYIVLGASTAFMTDYSPELGITVGMVYEKID